MFHMTPYNPNHCYLHFLPYFFYHSVQIDENDESASLSPFDVLNES